MIGKRSMEDDKGELKHNNDLKHKGNTFQSRAHFLIKRETFINKFQMS